MDEIHPLRDQVGADVVTLLLKTTGNTSGVGWLLDDLDPRFEAYAFNVTDICCATGGLVFAHELGHNMGAAHDWYVDADPGAFTYSHGYVEPGCGFKTIMAYGSQCQWFQPIANFANPDVQHEGATTGVQPGTNLGCRTGNRNNPPCDADNRLTLNNTARTVANFRQSIGDPAPTATATPIPPTNTPTNTPTRTPTNTPRPTCTPAAPLPRLTISGDATVGAPGSSFTIVGQNFPARATLPLSINGRSLTTVTTARNGTVDIVLVTLSTTQPGAYRLTVGTGNSAAVVVTIDPDAPLLTSGASGQNVTLSDDLQPQTSLYLPFVQQGNVAVGGTGGTCDTGPTLIQTAPPIDVPVETPTPSP